MMTTKKLISKFTAYSETALLKQMKRFRMRKVI